MSAGSAQAITNFVNQMVPGATDLVLLKFRHIILDRSVERGRYPRKPTHGDASAPDTSIQALRRDKRNLRTGPGYSAHLRTERLSRRAMRPAQPARLARGIPTGRFALLFRQRLS